MVGWVVNYGMFHPALDIVEGSFLGTDDSIASHIAVMIFET